MNVRRLCLAVANAAGTALVVIVPLATANVPGVQITARPANPTSSTTATFQFVNTLAAGAAFECQLDGGAFLPCLTPFQASTLADGSHTFAVRDAGLTSDRDSFSWTVDTSPAPVPTIDLTPPGAVRRATARAGDRAVTLTWAMPETPGIASVLIRRSVSGDPKATIVYRGLRTTFTSRGLLNGITYHFALIGIDRAGNASRPVFLSATPKANLLVGPQSGARVLEPPLLRWAPAARAAYFNVQLYRNGTKILSAWPDVARFQLAPRWSYRGHTFTLRPGVYTWFVWPGIGPRADVRYGELLGRSGFVVIAAGRL